VKTEYSPGRSASVARGHPSASRIGNKGGRCGNQPKKTKINKPKKKKNVVSSDAHPHPLPDLSKEASILKHFQTFTGIEYMYYTLYAMLVWDHGGVGVDGWLRLLFS
jgi:hypothetical protein